jgi:hypothetical protein
MHTICGTPFAKGRVVARIVMYAVAQEKQDQTAVTDQKQQDKMSTWKMKSPQYHGMNWHAP